ncbi:hypothetical protein PbJCM13498_03270 [Prolixibacter bellariivorans]|uniref:RNA polymerase sigma-70 region 2 domain-containing protein n=1 Tax=Prolixibacter bellariivorans TaxID=314319 RepID=A0A5M4AUN1_9BACT|nr:sigma-70 family RNA polymerase sigma factor [Prolixibacter bellariivorans]GET31464.1 hypothetical protein PbJCM13498_03270 [Prolixibacter bellariivorans]
MEAVAIKQHTIEREQTYIHPSVDELYERTFPPVAAFVRKMGGSFDDAKDIFHDALVVYMEIPEEDKKEVRATQEAYLLGIAKHLWIRKYHRDRREIALNDAESRITIPEDFYPPVQTKRLLRFLEVAGKKCMDLLRAFYYQNLSMKKLAGKLGYASVHSASVQKYKCMEKIRNTVKEKSLSYDDFTE